jgi:hypothetical protein
MTGAGRDALGITEQLNYLLGWLLRLVETRTFGSGRVVLSCQPAAGCYYWVLE